MRQPKQQRQPRWRWSRPGNGGGAGTRGARFRKAVPTPAPPHLGTRGWRASCCCHHLARALATPPRTALGLRWLRAPPLRRLVWPPTPKEIHRQSSTRIRLCIAAAVASFGIWRLPYSTRQGIRRTADNRNSPASRARPPRAAFGSMCDFMCALAAIISLDSSRIAPGNVPGMMIANQHHSIPARGCNGLWSCVPALSTICRSRFRLANAYLPRTEDRQYRPEWCDTGAASTPDGARLALKEQPARRSFSRWNHNVTCRTLPSSVNLLKTRFMLSGSGDPGPSPSCRFAPAEATGR